MKNQKLLLLLVTLIALLAGFLAGLWTGSRFAASPQPAQLSDLGSEQKDAYVALVAMTYAASHDKSRALAQLQPLKSPNFELLVSGVLERAARQQQAPEKLAALAQLALDLGAPRAALARYLPASAPDPATATVIPSPVPAATPTPTPTPAPARPSATPTPTPTPVPTRTATATATPAARARAAQTINVRSGPGTNYPVVGALPADEDALIVARNPAGDWWQIQQQDGVLGWVYGAVISITEDTSAIPEATEIPTPPATATPALAPTATAAPQPAGPTFRVVSRRLWGVAENGGEIAGEGINCGGKHELHIKVIDAAGSPLNGVTLQSLYDDEEHVTGDRGPGGTEWVLFAPGNGVKVIRDVDGSPVSSDSVDAPTDPRSIANSDLMAGGFCTSEAQCEIFKQGLGCFGHYSWDVVFQRAY